MRTSGVRLASARQQRAGAGASRRVPARRPAAGTARQPLPQQWDSRGRNRRMQPQTRSARDFAYTVPRGRRQQRAWDRAADALRTVPPGMYVVLVCVLACIVFVPGAIAGARGSSVDAAQESAQDELPQTGDGTFALIGLPALALLLVSAGLILAAKNRAERS